MRILITGGAGFIGSHLCDALIAEGHDIIVLDNFFTGSKNNIEHLLPNPRFELVRHDVILPIALEVDQIYHFACPASPIHYQLNPVGTTQTSVMGTINMLELAKRVNARILLASTSEVYGDPTVHPQRESYWGNVNPIGLRSCYNEGKRVAESLMLDYHRQSRVDIKIIRIFNTYGPRMAKDDGRVVSNFIVQALNDEEITLYGDGSQTRSFQYVSDLVGGTLKMMHSDNFKGPVNIGNPIEVTIRSLAERIVELTGSRSNITYLPLPEDDPSRRRPDIALARERLDWEPAVDLDTGLKKTIEYFDRMLTHAAANL
jgi:UDP-glucuronate decarboxylase